MRETRNFLLFQTIFVFCYIQKNVSFLFKSLHALRLIWRSLPHAYLSNGELTSVFSEDESEECLLTKQNLLMFFNTDVIDEEDVTLKDSDPYRRFRIQPRTLAHYCRTRIRYSLFENFALPTGISTFDIPIDLKSFLRLEW